MHQNLINRIETHFYTQPKIAGIGYALLHESLDELKKHQWRPITEKPPKNFEYYLVLVEKNQEKLITINLFIKEFGNLNITHWMPLPELP